jgi:prolyl-tRNA editing enzyme YbaK/EbsC (Cys-tRNA(Pro) deacylase)
MKKRGVEVKLILSGDRSPDPHPDPILIALVRRADEWMRVLQSGQATSLRDLASQKGVDRGDVSKALPLAYLAPDITQAILEGRQPVDLTAFRMKRIGALPVSWAEQRRLLGFV